MVYAFEFWVEGFGFLPEEQVAATERSSLCKIAVDKLKFKISKTLGTYTLADKTSIMQFMVDLYLRSAWIFEFKREWPKILFSAKSEWNEFEKLKASVQKIS